MAAFYRSVPIPVIAHFLDSKNALVADEVTRQVIDAGRPLRIAVHDHLVVGRDGVASFKALGLI